jgi:hypothetical protein
MLSQLVCPRKPTGSLRPQHNRKNHPRNRDFLESHIPNRKHNLNLFPTIVIKKPPLVKSDRESWFSGSTM